MCIVSSVRSIHGMEERKYIEGQYSHYCIIVAADIYVHTHTHTYIYIHTHICLYSHGPALMKLKA